MLNQSLLALSVCVLLLSGLGKTLEVAALVLLNSRAGSLDLIRDVVDASSLGGSIVPLLPVTRIPNHQQTTQAAGHENNETIGLQVPAAQTSRPHPPLLVDPLTLSQKAYSFYQNQVAASTTGVGSASAAAAAAVASHPSDNPDGECEFDPNSTPASVDPAAARPDIHCYCGHDVLYFRDPNETLVECNLCHRLQHSLCMRIGSADDQRAAAHPFQPSSEEYPYSYLCPSCAALPSTAKLPIPATLIVCPDVILQQWHNELHRHVNEGHHTPPMKIMIYKGVRAMATPTHEPEPKPNNRNKKSNLNDTTRHAPIATHTTAPTDDTLHQHARVDLIDFTAADRAPNVNANAAAHPSDKLYSVYSSTEDFVTIRVSNRSHITVAAGKKKAARTSSSSNSTSATSNRRNVRSDTRAHLDSDPDVPAMALPTPLQFACIRPHQFAGFDVVLTTYSTLRNDLYHTSTEQSAGRAARYAKKYQVLPSPLIGVNWWRLALDEAQMLGEGTTRCAEMALLLSSRHRWNVTGTPIYKSLEDLYGLLLFLGVMPYSNRVAWKRLLAVPYDVGHPHALARMHALVSRLMWRNTKASVAAQLNLPPTTYYVTRVTFTPIEQYYYSKRRDECRAASAQLRAYGRAALTTIQQKKVLHSLLRLRQACVHPQVGAAAGLVALTKQTMTLADLSRQMLREARLQCEEVQRRAYFAINGQAACVRHTHTHTHIPTRYQLGAFCVSR